MTESRIVTPDAGMELCYECDGEGVCLYCRGAGVENAKRCIAGGGECIVCAGAGQLSIGSEARADAASGRRVAIRVGCFRELGYDGPWSLEYARGKRSPEHLAEVVAYLRGGKLLVMSPGTVRDVFDQGTIAGTRSLRTDGDFTWPDSLAYYVERYAVELPPIFEARMAARSWVPPADVDLVGLMPSPE